MVKKITYENLYVTFAGAGAGKTYNMINKIELALRNLETHKFIVAITYTNAATDKIKSELSKKIKIPDNVFIGTMHSFFIRFVISPFYNIPNEKILYAEKILDNNNRWFEDKEKYFSYLEKYNHPKDKWEEMYKQYHFKHVKEIIDKLAIRGIITHDMVIEISEKILEDKEKFKIITNRLKCIFIDEYQDLHKKQHEIVLKLLKNKNIEIHVVSDPSQSIFDFGYNQNQVDRSRSPKIPLIYQLKEKCLNENFNVLKKNYRSTDEIINFINQYNSTTEQDLNDNKFKNIKFINATNKEEIIKKFQEKRKEFGLCNGALILAEEKKIFEEIKLFDNIVKDEKSSLDKTIFERIEKNIISFSGFNKKEFLDKNEISSFQLRCISVEIFRIISENKIIDSVELIKNIFSEKMGYEIFVNNTANELKLEKIQEFSYSLCNVSQNQLIFSTIHKAKGLEKESVLVIAKTKKQLLKWIEATKENIVSGDDDYRLGYVAFSRPKKLLVLSCFEILSELDLKKLQSKNCKII